MNIERILHPTDFSLQSENAFRIACSLARSSAAPLIVLHVAPQPTIGDGGLTPLPPSLNAYREPLEAQLRQVQTLDPSVAVEHRLVLGDTVSEILRVAQEMRCDLIVMGTHGRTGMGRMLMGSVAELVVRRATCPVLTVKTPMAEAPSNDPVTVYSLEDPRRAELIKIALEREGIPSLLAGIEQASTAALPGTVILIQVPANAAIRAREYIQQWESHS